MKKIIVFIVTLVCACTFVFATGCDKSEAVVYEEVNGKTVQDAYNYALEELQTSELYGVTGTMKVKATYNKESYTIKGNLQVYHSPDVEYNKTTYTDTANLGVGEEMNSEVWAYANEVYMIAGGRKLKVNGSIEQLCSTLGIEFYSSENFLLRFPADCIIETNFIETKSGYKAILTFNGTELMQNIFEGSVFESFMDDLEWQNFKYTISFDKDLNITGAKGEVTISVSMQGITIKETISYDYKIIAITADDIPAISNAEEFEDYAGY